MFKVEIGKITSQILVVILFTAFAQIWFQLGDTTIRSEDLILIFGLGFYCLTIFYGYRLSLSLDGVSVSILMLVAYLLFSSLLVNISHYTAELKRESLISSIRLSLIFISFFYFKNLTQFTERKVKVVLGLFIGFAILESLVCLLQMVYWDNLLSISLPGFLTEMAEGANEEEGREIFGLYIGNSGTHTLSAVLAISGLLLWILIRNGILKHQVLGYLFFALILIIIGRTSVRNSILALFFGISFFELFLTKQTKFKALLKRSLVILALLCILLVLYNLESDSYFVSRIQMLLPVIKDGTISIHRGSNIFGRLHYWFVAMEMFSNNPVFGTGFYTYKELGPTVHAHNSYFNILAEMGTIGFIVFIVFFIACIKVISKHRKRLIDKKSIFMSLNDFATCFIVFLAVASVFSNAIYSTQIMSLLIIIISFISNNEKSLSYINND